MVKVIFSKLLRTEKFILLVIILVNYVDVGKVYPSVFRSAQ